MAYRRLTQIKKVYTKIATCKDGWYQTFDSKSINCAICKKGFTKKYFNSDTLEDFCNNAKEEYITIDHNSKTTFEFEKYYRNFYSFFYREIIDCICNRCFNSQNLLPEEEFYSKLAEHIRNVWGIQ